MEYVLYPLLSIWLLWVFYLAVMNLVRAKKEDTLNAISYIFGYPVLIIGLLLDILVNIIILTIVMFELPKELLVTARLRRLKKQNNWRAKLAAWIGKYLLDPFDPSGSHV